LIDIDEWYNEVYGMMHVKVEVEVKGTSPIPSMIADILGHAITHKPSRVRLHCALLCGVAFWFTRRVDGEKGFVGELR
jgi:hypothetical protein